MSKKGRNVNHLYTTNAPHHKKYLWVWKSMENVLRANVSMHQTNSGKSPKIYFHSYFHIL